MITATGRADVEAEAHEITRREMEAWFDWMDRILDVHRANFVFRQAAPNEVDHHKATLRMAIRKGLLINAMISDPDSHEPRLASRLKVRIQQLEDAYSTFNEADFSEQQAQQLLKQVFPE